jgi:Sulfatase
MKARALLPESRPEDHTTPNTVLWLVFVVTSLGVGGFFVFQVHRRLGVDAALAVGALLARTGLLLSVGLLIETLALRTRGGYLTLTRGRRLVLHAGAVALLLICVLLVVDLFVFAFAGYHLTTALRILFSDGPAGAGKVVEATGLPMSVVLGGLLGVAVALAAAFALSKITRRLSSRRRLPVTRRTALMGVVASIAAVALLDVAGYSLRNPYLWERELKSMPLAFALVRPPAELLSLQVSVKKPDLDGPRAAVARVAPAAKRPDIFVLVLESLRRDIVTPEVMPRFAAFASDAYTFEHAQTTGNVTHYSWYGLFCGGYPLFFDVLKNVPAEHGSPALAALGRAGYPIRLFATPDTAYQNLESVVFGPKATLLHDKFHPPDLLPAERDRHVIDALSRTLAAEPPGGVVYLVALDSTHYDYAWGKGFSPPFAPYAADASIARRYEVDGKARAQLWNRYRDAAAWMDTLVGRFLDALAQSGRLDSSIVVITGDHGEAFWEHGSGTHGSDLGPEQLDVGFALKLPGRAPRRFDAVFSLMDVMPTVLAEIGVDASTFLPGVALQRRISSPDGPLAPRAALTFQGWNTQAFRYSLTYGAERLIFELDQANPLLSRRLVLKDITDLDGTSLAGRRDSDVPAAYHHLLRDLPAVLDAMPFLSF